MIPDLDRFKHLGVLNGTPLIVMSCIDSFYPLDQHLADELADCLQKPFLLMLQVWKSVEYVWSVHQAGITQLCRAIIDHRHRNPANDIVILCNTPNEVEIFRSQQVTAIFVSHNCFVNESVFKPRGLEKDFDAVYNAQMWDIKRHQLAREISPLALIYSLHLGAPALDRLREVKRLMPEAWLANGDPLCEGGKYRHLSAQEVNAVYNQAQVGLCLSAVEGAMFSCVEYLLAGLSVVTTRNLGGRDEFLHEAWSLWCEADPASAARAVRDVIDRRIPPEQIRAGTLALIKQHRQELTDYLDHHVQLTGGTNELPARFHEIVESWGGLQFNSLRSLLKGLEEAA